MKVTIIRVSELSRKVEYEPVEMGSIDKKEIIDRFGRCETGEILYCKVSGELKLELHYDSQCREYREYTGNY